MMVASMDWLKADSMELCWVGLLESQRVVERVVMLD